MPPQPKAKTHQKAKPYEQMQYPDQRVQVDVKVVPLKYLTNPEGRLYQYTVCVIWLLTQSKAPTFPLIFRKRWWPGSNAAACGSSVFRQTTALNLPIVFTAAEKTAYSFRTNR